MSANPEVMGLLVVGTGFLGRQRAAAARASKHFRLVAVTDRDATLAERVASKLGVVAVPDLATGLESRGVDAVVIATPHADHAEAIETSLEAGKHVLVEKPLTVRPDDARHLATMADASRLTLATGLNHRFYPPIRDALTLVDAGAIGRVESVRAEIGHHASPEFPQVLAHRGRPVRRRDPDGQRPARLRPDPPIARRGRAGQGVRPAGPSRSPPAASPRRSASSGTTTTPSLSCHASWNLRVGYLSIDVRGSEGHLRVETAPWRLTGHLADGRSVDRNYLKERVAERIHRLRHGCERSIVAELDAFGAIGAPHPRANATGWDGCRVTEMIHAVYQSDRTGDEVHLKPLLVNLPAGNRRRTARESHPVSDRPLADPDLPRDRRIRAVTATPRARFVETLDALDASGFRAVDLETLGRARPAGRRPSRFALAFDDGLASILAVADEIVRRSIPATIFLVSGRDRGRQRLAGPAERRPPVPVAGMAR